MESVTIRELRNNGGAVLDRVVKSEVLVVTRDGAEVGELRPRPRPRSTAAGLIARRRALPVLDVGRLRRHIDSTLAQSL